MARARLNEDMSDGDDGRVWRFEDGSTIAFQDLANIIVQHSSPFAVDLLSDAPNSYRFTSSTVFLVARFAHLFVRPSVGRLVMVGQSVKFYLYGFSVFDLAAPAQMRL